MTFLARECYANYFMPCDFALIVYATYKLKGETKATVGALLTRVLFYTNLFLGKKC